MVHEILKRYGILRDTYSHESLQTLLKFECYLRSIEAGAGLDKKLKEKSKFRAGNSILTLTDGLMSQPGHVDTQMQDGLNELYSKTLTPVGEHRVSTSEQEHSASV